MITLQDAPQQNSLLELFKGLGNPTRYEIFRCLMTSTHCNCEIAESLGISLSLVSHHLHILLNLGLVNSRRDEKDGRWVYYSTDTSMLKTYRKAFLQLTDPTQIQEHQPECGMKSFKKP